MAKGCPASPRARGNFLIPGLPNEVALVILVRLPRALHGSFRCVCSTWRDALEPSSVNTLRKELGISEMWTTFLFRDRRISLYDPLLQLLSTPICLPHPRDRHTDRILHVLGASGSEVFILETTLNLDCSVQKLNIHCFDAASMQWQSNPTPLSWKLPRRVIFRMVGCRLFFTGAVVGAAKKLLLPLGQRKVARLDVKTRISKMMPKMIKKRSMASAVVLQGCLHVIGGHNSSSGWLQSGEIWDRRSRKWMLEPELWPAEHFASGSQPNVAVAMDTLYALEHTHDNEQDKQWKLMHYVSASKIWASLGFFSFNEYLCSSCKRKRLCRLVGAGAELWLVFNCNRFGKICTAKILSCVPTTKGPPPLVWKSVPVTSSSKFQSGYADVHNHVHV